MLLQFYLQLHPSFYTKKGPNNASECGTADYDFSYSNDGDRDFKPNTRTHTSVIDAWAKSGEKGAAKRAEQILNKMISSYEASGDPEILQAAENLGRRIIAEGEQVMRIEGGQAGEAFLRLALARQKIQRLEFELGKAEQSIIIRDHGSASFADRG